MARHFGYIANPEETAAILADRATPIHEMTSGERAELRVGSPKEDRDAVILFDALQRVHPTWRRGAQGIGDCFAAGTMVSGPDGSRPIEQVQVGDRVFSGDGSVTEVVTTQAKTSGKGLVRITTYGGRDLLVTPDHQVLIYRMPQVNGKGVTVNTYRRQFQKAQNAPGSYGRPNAVVEAYEARATLWVSASELLEGDLLLRPMECEQYPEPEYHPFVNDRWVLGLFAGDGHASNGSVEFTFALHETANYDRVCEWAEKSGYKHTRTLYGNRNAFRLRIHDRELVKWLRRNCYMEDGTKCLPHWANQDVIDGLIAADGHSTDKSVTFDSTSYSLADAVVRHWTGLGLNPSISEVVRSHGAYDNAKPLYRVSCLRHCSKRTKVWNDGTYLCHRVRSVTHDEGTNTVYDIGVAHESHSLIANGYVAHNCVSWGFELMATLHHAVDIVVKGLPWEWRGEYATEPLYGGGRVEARGRRTGGWSDGSYGGAQIKWMTQWGCLLRIDYSVATGISEHDLRQYDSRKAKNWGNYGCGGQHDNGKLDAVAKETPIVEGRLVTTYDEAVALIENGYPVAVCSGQGFGKRGADGFAPPRGSWAHCMCFTGVRYDKPGLLLTNSWGNSWGTHAMPHVEWDQVRRCSAWCDPRTAGRMLAGRDSFAGVGIDGLKRRRIEWGSGWDIAT